jgi:hypothetical protein
MSNTPLRRNIAVALVGMAVVGTVGLSHASAQRRDWRPLQTIEPGTRVSVPTTRTIDERNLSRRVFPGIVDEDVFDTRDRLAIPRGAAVELIVRERGNRELYLDLESINMNGQWYGVDARQRAIGGGTRVDSTIGANQETAEHVGGGALIGSILGAIIGGGKGAAVGAVAGAGVGAATQMQVHGEYVHVPAESLITFRLDSPLTVGWKDPGRDRDRDHYHDDDRR